MGNFREIMVLTIYGALLFMVINNYKGFTAILDSAFKNWNSTLTVLQGPAAGNH
jgi:hypothetical protein